MNNPEQCEHQQIMDNIEQYSPYSEDGPITCPECGQNVKRVVQRKKFRDATSDWMQSDKSEDSL